MHQPTAFEIHAALTSLTVKELLSRVKGIIIVPTSKRNKKTLLVEHIIALAPPEQLAFLCRLSEDRRSTEADQNPKVHVMQRKRKTDDQYARRTARRIDDEGEAHRRCSLDDFMALPTEQEHRACYSAFYQATSNAAVASKTCGICAREVSVLADAVKDVPISLLPNAYRLHPSLPHPAHTLQHVQ